MDEKKQTKSKKIAKVLDIVFNIIFVPLILFTSIFAFSVIFSRIRTGYPSIFGYTQIQIVSGSMQDAGFNIGDKCFVKSTDTNDLEIGDYIAFFQYADPNCSSPAQVTSENIPASSAKTSKIVFHEIVDIVTDSNGNKWFTTQGTNNAGPDSIEIYQDYVIGRYVDEPNFWTKTISFVSSSIGIIVMVVVPCAVIIGIDTYQLIVLGFESAESKKQAKKQARQKAIEEEEQEELSRNLKEKPLTKIEKDDSQFD